METVNDMFISMYTYLLGPEQYNCGINNNVVEILPLTQHISLFFSETNCDSHIKQCKHLQNWFSVYTINAFNQKYSHP